MKDFLLHPFALGFYTACIFLCIALYHLLRLKAEYARSKDRNKDLQTQNFESQTEAFAKLKTERDSLGKENENLRMKVQAMTVQPEQKLARELEIFARAERKMTVAAPGFASPWEQAKQDAHHEIVDEEAGKARPRTLFQRFLGGAIPSGGGEQPRSLPASADGAKSTTPTAG